MMKRLSFRRLAFGTAPISKYNLKSVFTYFPYNVIHPIREFNTVFSKNIFINQTLKMNPLTGTTLLFLNLMATISILPFKVLYKRIILHQK